MGDVILTRQEQRNRAKSEMAIYTSGPLGDEGEMLADMIKKEVKPSLEFHQKLEKTRSEKDLKQVEASMMELTLIYLRCLARL